MTLTAAQMAAKVTKLTTNMDRFNSIVNGSNTTNVTTDAGSVPSYAKFIYDTQAYITGQTAAITDAVASTAADAATATTKASQAATSATNAAASATTAQNAAANAITQATWAALNGISGLFANQKAEVPDTDTGTHTDPVVGGTVANAGVYIWSTSPAGWKRIGSTGLTAKADKSVIDVDPAYNRNELAVYLDGAGKLFGLVYGDAAWDLLLTGVKTRDFTIEIFERNGQDVSELVIVDANGYVLWRPSTSAALTDAINEIAAARGNQSSLNARLSQWLNSTGNPKSKLIGREFLRQCHQRLTSLALGEGGQLNIACGPGDSFTQNGSRWPTAFTNYLVSKYGDGGGGWTGYSYFGAYSGPYVIGGTQPSTLNGNARSTLYPVRFKGAWDRVYNASVSPDLGHVFSSTPGDMIERDLPAAPTHTAIKLFWIGTADGVIRWRIGAGSWTTQNVQGTVGALQYVDLAVSAGAQTIQIEVVSGTVKLCGDNALSSANGVRVHKIAGSGSQVSQWVAQTAADQQAGWAALGINAFLMMDGTNSQGSVVSPSVWKTNMATLIDRMRAAVAYPDIAILMPPDNQRTTNTYAMPLYADQARDLSVEKNVTFRDFQPDFGVQPSDYASTSGYPLFQSDNIHPEPLTGGRLLVQGALSLVIPF